MHDGSIVTLSAVLDQYASGGRGHATDLLAFLESLTDEAFLSDRASSREGLVSSVSCYGSEIFLGIVAGTDPHGFETTLGKGLYRRGP